MDERLPHRVRNAVAALACEIVLARTTYTGPDSWTAVRTAGAGQLLDAGTPWGVFMNHDVLI